MKKLTDPQRKALQAITDNPGEIGVRQDKRVHGNVINSLYSRGYVEGYNPETGRSYHEESNGDAMLWYSGRYCWRLTKAGREVMGPEPTVVKPKAVIVTRDELHLLSTVARAADRHPANDILWAESVMTMRAVIDMFDAALPEALAADAQAKVNRIMDLSTRTDQAAITRSADLIAELAALG